MTVDTLRLPVSTPPEQRDTDLFPLPLAPFEQYMLEDDRPEYPASFFLRLGLSGTFDRPAFVAAVNAALRRHPLLRASVAPLGKKRFQWLLAEHPDPLITWRTDGPPSTPAACPRIDLRQETGLRIFCGEQGDQTEVLLQFHHACCDGLGAVRFAEDLLGSYHNALADDSRKIDLPPLDPRRLLKRNTFGLNPLKYVLRAYEEVAGALGALQYFFLRPVPLVPQQRAGSAAADADRPAITGHTFTVAETKRLCQLARRTGCTVNDLLLRDLFLALHAWVAQHDPASQDAWMRIVIPTSLRKRADAATPAANIVSLVFNDRRPGRFASPRRLLGLLQIQMNFCKRWRLGLSTIHMFSVARRFRGGLQRLLRPDRCRATAVLSNMGDLSRVMVLPRVNGRLAAANVTLDRIELMPPVRPLTHASFGVLTYAGQMTVGLMYDGHHFSKQTGRQLLDGFVRRIQATLADESNG